MSSRGWKGLILFERGATLRTSIDVGHERVNPSKCPVDQAETTKCLGQTRSTSKNSGKICCIVGTYPPNLPPHPTAPTHEPPFRQPLPQSRTTPLRHPHSLQSARRRRRRRQTPIRRTAPQQLLILCLGGVVGVLQYARDHVGQVLRERRPQAELVQEVVEGTEGALVCRAQVAQVVCELAQVGLAEVVPGEGVEGGLWWRRRRWLVG